jgi:hypothetical protein
VVKFLSLFFFDRIISSRNRKGLHLIRTLQTAGTSCRVGRTTKRPD